MANKPGASQVLETVGETGKKTGKAIIAEAEKTVGTVWKQILGTQAGQDETVAKIEAEEKQKEKSEKKKLERALHDEAHRLGQIPAEEQRRLEREKQWEQLHEQADKEKEGQQPPPLEENTQLLPASSDRQPALFKPTKKKTIQLPFLRRGTHESTKKAA